MENLYWKFLQNRQEIICVEVSFHIAVALELETSLKIGLQRICFHMNLRNFSGKVFVEYLYHKYPNLVHNKK